MVFPVVIYGCESWDHKEGWVLRNWCFWIVVLKKTLESPLDCKEIKVVNPKGGKSWIFNERTDAEAESNTLDTWCKERTSWKRPWCWEKLKAGGEGDDRGWNGWTALLTQWTWVWASSGSWWWTGKPGAPQSMGSKRVRHDWATELNWKFSNPFLDPLINFSLIVKWPGERKEVSGIRWCRNLMNCGIKTHGGTLTWATTRLRNIEVQGLTGL